MSEQDIPEDLITFDVAAELCGVSVGSFRRWRRTGKLDEHITFYEGPPPEGGGLPVPMVSRVQIEAYLSSKSGRTDGRTNARTNERTRGRTHARTDERTDARTHEHTHSRTGEQPSDLAVAHARIAELEAIIARQRDQLEETEDTTRALSVKLETVREEREAYGQIFAGELRLLTDRVAEQNQQTTALQVRASAEVHVARQEAGMLAEQLDDMRKGQELLAQAQKMTAEQYEARISDLRSGHVRELNAVREVAAAQVQVERAQRAALQEQLAAQAKAHQEQLARTQGEVDRLVAQGAERDRRLAQQEAELAAYRAWAAKGGLGRMLSRPEVPTAPRGLLPGSDTE